jgi:ribosome-binding protein aMBF1 (putative translation factor)
MNRLQRRIRSTLSQAGLNQTALAAQMKVSSSDLSLQLKRNMTMKSAINLSESLFVLTGVELTLHDFKE